jgi:hypothetical protein
VLIKSASGLRDTDFLPGVDKSDPYCVCQIVGKPDTKVTTRVISDCLDPVWNEEVTVGPYEAGDSLVFSVYDEDLGNDALCTDDLLGTVTVAPQDVFSTDGLRELPLEEAGKGITASLTIEISGPCTAFPDLLDMEREPAEDLLRLVRPDLSITVEEVVPEGLTFSVVSWDAYCSNNGYKKNFFGAYEEDVVSLKEGDSIIVYPRLQRSHTSAKMIGDKQHFKTYSFDHIGGPRGPQQKVHGKMIRYIFVKEESVGVSDNMQWRRLPRPHSPGFFSEPRMYSSRPRDQ